MVEALSFSQIQTEFLARIRGAVYCSMATIDRKSRPRSRVMHPIWDGPVGWVISWPASHKAKHLKRNPFVSLAYIHNEVKPVYIDALAVWETDIDEKQRIWKLHKTSPPPLGFDPQPHYGSIDHQHFGLLKFTPWRIELADLHGDSIVWRQELSR